MFVASGGVLAQEIRDDGFEFFTIATLAVDRRSPIDIVRTILSMRRIFKEQRPDVIHAHNAASIMLAAVAAVSVGLKPALIQSVRGIELRATHQWRNWIYRINPAILLAVSEFTKRELVAIGARPQRIRVTYNGVDPEKFNPDRIERKTVRAELGLREDELAIGHVGNFSGWKGQDVLVHALAILKRKGHAVQVVFVGDGPARLAAEEAAEKHGVREAVQFLGFRRDIPEVQAAIDIYCQPSTEGEMFPNAIVEAMAMGNCWVGSDISGLGELTVNGDAGDLVPAGDAYALAAALDLRLSNVKDLRNRGVAARRFVLDNLTVERVVDRIASAYKEAQR